MNFFYDPGRTKFAIKFLKAHPSIRQAIDTHNIKESEITQQTANT